MAWTAPYTFVALQTLTAAQLNAMQTNISTLFPYTTAGDLAYASSATALARLPKGTAGQVLKMNAGASAPEWGNGIMLTGISATISTATTSTSFVDVANSEFNMTLTQTSTILLFTSMTAKVLAGNSMVMKSYIDGTAGAEGIVYPGGQDIDTQITLMQRKINVAVGTRTLKIQYKSSGGSQVNLYNGNVYAIAIPE